MKVGFVRAYLRGWVPWIVGSRRCWVDRRGNLFDLHGRPITVREARA